MFVSVFVCVCATCFMMYEQSRRRCRCACAYYTGGVLGARTLFSLTGASSRAHTLKHTQTTNRRERVPLQCYTRLVYMLRRNRQIIVSFFTRVHTAHVDFVGELPVFLFPRTDLCLHRLLHMHYTAPLKHRSMLCTACA